MAAAWGRCFATGEFMSIWGSMMSKSSARRAAYAVALGMVAVLLPVGAANAATGGVSAVSLSVVSDGTAPFDSDDAAGHDSGPANGIVRTSDFVTYRWAYSIATAGDVNFTQTLPAGMVWDASSTSNCAEGPGAISTNRLTLSCTLANAGTGAGAYNVKAKVLGAGNGAILATSVTATTGSVTSNTASVTASGTPKVILNYYSGQTPNASAGPGALSGQAGYKMVDGADLYSPIDPVNGVRGLESLASPITFQVDAPNVPGAVIVSCNAGASNSGVPNGSGGTTNSVINSGTVTCSQPGGAGTPAFVSYTNTNTTLDTWPSTNQAGALLPADRAYIATANVVWWFPKTSIPDNTATTILEQARNFSPVSVSGAINFAPGYAPNFAPGDGCVAGGTGPRNCSSRTINTTPGPFTFDMRVFAPGTTSIDPLPGSDNGSTGNSPAYAGEPFDVQLSVLNPVSNPVQDSMTSCMTWDTALQTLDPTRLTDLNAAAGTVVEYGVIPFADNNARRGFNCGLGRDGAANWYPSVAAAGGPAGISAIRAVYTNPAQPSKSIIIRVPFFRTTDTLVDGSPIAMFATASSQQTAFRASAYNEITNSGVQTRGQRVLAASARVTNSVAWDAAGALPGEIHKVTVTPVVDNPYASGLSVTASDVRVVVTLPDPCVSYQQNSASIAPISVAAGTGTCGAGGTGQVITFDLGPRQSDAPIAPITFKTIVNPQTATPSTEIVKSVISSASDGAIATARTSTSPIVVNGVASFAVTKTASSVTAEPNIPFSYTIGWANGLSVDVGTASFVDVLPFNGDGRGTTGLSGLSVGAVTPSSADVSVLYTGDPSAQVLAAVQADPSGATGITWSATRPSTITAIRFLTPDLTPGTAQSATVEVTPADLSRTGMISNDVWGIASNLADPVRGAANVSMTSSAAQLSGNVYKDVDYSFSRTAGDTPVDAPTVRITGGYAYGANGIDDGGTGDDIVVTTPIVATSNAAGDYDFAGVAPGKYTVSVTPPAGTRVAVAPTMPITLAPGATVTDQDFGLQDIIAAPSLVNDSGRTESGVPITAAPMANDTVDPSATITAVGPASNGSVVNNGDDTVTYTPAGDFVGQDSFTYTVTDKARQSATATVTITVLALPNAVNDAYTIPQNAAFTANVMSNDTGNLIALDAITVAAEHGVATISGPNISYTPAAGYHGPDTVTYRIKDALNQTATAVVTFTVQAAPSAADDAAQTATGRDVTIAVLSNDTGTSLSVLSVTTPGHGTTTSNPDGTITYHPSAGYSGTDSFRYTVKDSLGQTSSANVTVTVYPLPDSATLNVRLGVGASVTTPYSVGLNWPSGAGVETTSATPGTATVDATAGTVTYVAASAPGAAQEVISYTDPVGQVGTVTINYTIIAGPSVSDLSAATGQDRDVVVRPLDGAAGDALTLFSVGVPSHGTAVKNSDGTVTYSPATGFTGQDTFTFTVHDSLGESATGTATITVYAVPTTTTASVKVPTGGSASTDLSSLVNWPTGAGSVTGAASSGTATYSGGAVAYSAGSTPGSDSVVVSYTDPAGQTGAVTITYQVVDSASAVADSAQTTMSQPTTIDVLANDLGDEIEITAVSAPLSGSAEIVNGKIVYTPNGSFSGVTSFRYTITDSFGVDSIATVTVAVFGTPSPQGMNSATDFETSVSVQAWSFTPSGDAANYLWPAVTVSVTNGEHGSATLSADGILTYVPDDGFSGTDVVTYTVRDAGGQTATATWTIEVRPAPEPTPSATPEPSDTPVTPGSSGSGDPTQLASVTPTATNESRFTLPFTGSDVAPWLGLSAALLAAGGLLLLLVLRRRRNDDDDTTRDLV